MPDLVAHAFYSSPQKTEADACQIEANLNYRTSSRPFKTTYWDLVSENKTKQNKNNKIHKQMNVSQITVAMNFHQQHFLISLAYLQEDYRCRNQSHMHGCLWTCKNKEYTLKLKIVAQTQDNLKSDTAFIILTETSEVHIICNRKCLWKCKIYV